MKKEETAENLRYRIQACQSIGKRQEQQDSYGSVQADHSILLIMADGMGGMKRGGFFSKKAVEIVSEAFRSQKALTEVERLRRLYQQAQLQLQALQEEENEGGTTLVLALIHKARLWFLSAGDSRLYLARGGGIIQLTRDQVLGIRLEERAALGFLSMEDALENQCRDSLDNFLGAAKPKEPDQNMSPIELRAGDCIALMSDGVYRTLGEERLASLLCQPSEQLAQKVIHHVALENMPRQDNNSIVLAIAEEDMR